MTNQIDAKAFVDDKVASSKVMVFSKSYCPYCKKTKSTFQFHIDRGNLNDDDYDVVELNERNDCEDLQDYLETITGARTVPRVFINGNLIGGCEETMRLHETRELKTLVKS